MHRAVIVVPVYREALSVFEVQSIRQLSKILGRYPIRIVTYPGLNLDGLLVHFEQFANLEVEYFSPKYFRSPQSYNKLLRSLKFFSRFASFEFLLMHHTDSYVFQDELQHWMDRDYDYIGAPMYAYDGTIRPKKYIGVGNGGFSMHKIRSAIKVLNSFRIVYPSKDVLEKLFSYNWKGRLYYAPYFLRLLLGLGTNAHYLLNNSRLNEDLFWGILVPGAFDWYRVADFDTALQFSMEYNCEELYELNGKQLPFGCHQWYKGEFLEFWINKVQV